MQRFIRFLILLLVIFGAMSLLQHYGLDQGTAIMIISMVFVAFALLVSWLLKKKKDNAEHQS